MKKNLLLLTITILFSFLSMEGVLRMMSSPSKIEIGSLKAEKSQIYGWALDPNTNIGFMNPDNFEIFYEKTNSQGWKDIEHIFDKPKGIIRILFLGDSNTYGRVPHISDIYTRQVEFLLKKEGFRNIEVIAIALGGWGTDQALEALEVEGIRYNPDFVIYQFTANDIFDNLEPLEDTPPSDFHWKKTFRYKLINGNLERVELYHKTRKIQMVKSFLLKSSLISTLNKAKNTIINYLTERTDSEDKRLYNNTLKGFKEIGLINPLITYYRHSSVNQTEQLKEAWQLLEALILKMKSVSEANNAKFIIFSEAGDDTRRDWEIKMKRIQSDGSSDFITYQGVRHLVDLKRPTKNLGILCKKHNIPFIEPKRKYYRYRRDAHPNIIGNINMAKDITDFLLSWKPFLEKVKLDSL